MWALLLDLLLDGGLVNKGVVMDEAPAIRLVYELINNALHIQASDIHCEPLREHLRIRYRVDGVLFDQSPIETSIASQVLSRIKVLAHIDVAERRIPQDGKFSIIVAAGTVDFRVATFPSLYGEKIVVRILDRCATIFNIQNIGLNHDMRASVSSIMHKPRGFFLVTGPTGSGKTTTLYAALSLINNHKKNIVTLEDPVEYTIDGITQGLINQDIGFTFERGIRALLRQDPDVIMVGEIRDAQTARVAIQAALTGHLVISTLHTNDAPGALMRLLDMNIEPFLINAALTGVLAQRLARRLCASCRYEVPLDSNMQAVIERYGLLINHAFMASGCEECYGLGERGRIGLFECLAISERIRTLLHDKPDFDTISGQAWHNGWRPLLYDAACKVDEGIISFNEILNLVA